MKRPIEIQPYHFTESRNQVISNVMMIRTEQLEMPKLSERKKAHGKIRNGGAFEWSE
jgi:hypothetical protein